VGAANSGGFQAPGAAAAAGMGGMRSSGSPPLDASSLSTQVNLAGFGLGGLGNGERAACYYLLSCPTHVCYLPAVGPCLLLGACCLLPT